MAGKFDWLFEDGQYSCTCENILCLYINCLMFQKKPFGLLRKFYMALSLPILSCKSVSFLLGCYSRHSHCVSHKLNGEIKFQRSVYSHLEKRFKWRIENHEIFLYPHYKQGYVPQHAWTWIEVMFSVTIARSAVDSYI